MIQLRKVSLTTSAYSIPKTKLPKPMTHTLRKTTPLSDGNPMADNDLHRALGKVEGRLDGIEGALVAINDKLDGFLNRLQDTDRRLIALEISSHGRKEKVKWFASNWKTIAGLALVAAAWWVRSIVLAIK